jgi:hypothetical protein
VEGNLSDPLKFGSGVLADQRQLSTEDFPTTPAAATVMSLSLRQSSYPLTAEQKIICQRPKVLVEGDLFCHP